MEYKKIDGRRWELEGTSTKKERAQERATKIRNTFKNVRVVPISKELWGIYSKPRISKEISRGKYW